MRNEELCRIVDEDGDTLTLEIEAGDRGLVTQGRALVKCLDASDGERVQVYLSPEARRTLAESLLDGLE